ncbi:chloramphenicol phosphotransferase CPT family protein [Thiorhodococcus fuscus]|uniref:Chloramphenicol phosphotransferase CPT family protein n=1 Tax=Thiorhodococcus fuscus TaxID=527200 RepID=A0ABW4YB15_9GAMM
MDASRPRVILLNGVSSAGKSSIARALQETLDGLYFFVEFDGFLGMAPARYKSDAVLWSAHQARIMTAYGTALLAYLDCGLNLILDNVLPCGSHLLSRLTCILSPYEVYFVAVHCPLVELESRELRRGDRPVGQARLQFMSYGVHEHGHYDLQLDTSRFGPVEAAAHIKQRVESGPAPEAFAALRAEDAWIEGRRMAADGDDQRDSRISGRSMRA